VPFRANIHSPKGKKNTPAKEDKNMKRAERSEYTYIKNSLKKYGWTYGTVLTIRTNAGAEYKEALHRLYTEKGFHPAAVSCDNHRFDGQERIHYIYGLTWQDDEGREHSWEELYTEKEKAFFAAKLA
jgi:hypothetical protein